MSEMVAKVALAIANAFQEGTWGGPPAKEPPNKLARSMASAAIAAMAIPNDKMVLSGMLMAVYVANEGPTNQACSIWTAMAEAAIEPVDDEVKAK